MVARPRAAPAGPRPRAWVARAPRRDVVDATAGVRSLLVQVDGRRAHRRRRAAAARRGRGRPRRRRARRRCRRRVVHLPLSWDDPATREAIERYMHGVRADAPWCPWNIEFIRRINGLADRRRRPPHRVRRVVPRARARRRLPRRAGRDAARSPPPPRHHEVQPGPHVDAGERRRHRRRLPVHLRHGGPGRLPVRRAHRAGVEPRPPRPALRTAVAAAAVRPAAVPPGRRPTSCSTCGPSRPPGGWRSAIDEAHVPRSPTTARSSPTTPTRSPPSAPPSRPRSPPSGRRGRTSGESRAMTTTAVDGRRRVRSTRIADDGRAGRLDHARRAPTCALAAAARRRRRAGRAAPTCRWPASTLAVKDNIDVAGLPTTAGCPAFAYAPGGRRTGRRRARRRAGAVVIGKTNLDQFATGLVGVRSPYGIAPNAHWRRADPRRVEQRLGRRRRRRAWSTSPSAPTPPARGGCRRRATGSSGSSRPAAGSATAASCRRAGRSTACRCSPATWRRGVARSPARRRAGSRRPVEPVRRRWRRRPERPLRVGVPARARRRPRGRSPPLRRQRRASSSSTSTSTPFVAAGALLYGGAFVAERYEAVGAFVDAHRDDVHPVVGEIIAAAGRLPGLAGVPRPDRAGPSAAATAPVWDRSTSSSCRACRGSRRSTRCSPTRSPSTRCSARTRTS